MALGGPGASGSAIVGLRGCAVTIRNACTRQGKAKALIDERFAALVGPRTPEDDVREAAARESKKKAGGSKKEGKASAAADGKPAAAAAAGASSAPAAGAAAAAAGPAAAAGGGEAPSSGSGAFEGRELKAAFNTPALLAAHAAATGGKVGASARRRPRAA